MLVVWCRYGRVLVVVEGQVHARARLRTIEDVGTVVDGICRSPLHHAFRPFVSLLGSVFDEEHVGAVQNEPTCVFPSEKLVEFGSWEDAVVRAVRGRVLMLTWSKRSFQPFVSAANRPIRRSFRRRVRCCRQKRSSSRPSSSNFGLNLSTSLRARLTMSGKSKSRRSQKSITAQILLGLDSSFWSKSRGEDDEGIGRGVLRWDFVYFHRVCGGLFRPIGQHHTSSEHFACFLP